LVLARRGGSDVRCEHNGDGDEIIDPMKAGEIVGFFDPQEGKNDEEGVGQKIESVEAILLPHPVASCNPKLCSQFQHNWSLSS
jgi:hypothetical protein